MSNGGTGSGNWMKQAKQVRDVMKRLGITDADELEKMLGDVSTDIEPATTDIPSPIASAPSTACDPLAWITHETPSVNLVAKNKNLSLRPSFLRMNPPIESVQVFAWTEGTWNALPFDLTHKDPNEEKKMRMYARNWGHFRITKAHAEFDVYGDDRYPLPGSAVVDPSDFMRWDHAANRAIGKYSDLGPDVVPLREVIRRTLQRKAGACFINMRYHPDLDPRVVNPYCNELMGRKIHVVEARSDDIPEIKV